MKTPIHLRFNGNKISKYCILPGDPGRCEIIASFLESPHLVGSNREFTIWNGTLDGTLVTVCSTGIGGPSAAIALEELVEAGAHTFIRVGTCGGIATKVRSGECVIATAAVRQEGTSCEYAPIEYPAATDFRITSALAEAALHLKLPHHIGVVQSKDSFYGQHAAERMPVSEQLLQKWQAWKRLGVLASEMETAALATVAACLSVSFGAVFLTLWNQERAKLGLLDSDVTENTSAIKVAIEALRILIK